jgi:hypothetical protein
MASNSLEDHIGAFVDNDTVSVAACLEWYPFTRFSLQTPSDYVRFFIQVPFTLSLMVIGLAVNCLAYIVLSREMKGSSTLFLLKFLAVADCSVLVSVLLLDPLADIYRFTGQLESYSEYFYVPYESYLVGMTWVCKTSALYGIVSVTVERYVAVCKPHRAKSLCTINRSKKVVSAMVMFSMVFNSPRFFIAYAHYKYDDCTKTLKPILYTNKIWNDPYFIEIYDIWMTTFITFLIPFSICFVLNVVLIRSLHNPPSTEIQVTGKRERESRVLIVRVVVLVTTFLVLELPREMALLCSLFIENETLTNFNILMFSMMILSSVVNFFLYFLTGRRFRKIFWQLFSLSGNNRDRE